MSFITILTLYIFVSKQTKDEETDQTSALDGGVQADERPHSGRENKPFDIRFVCKDGTISECYNVQRAVSYNREKGYRKLVMPNGDFRYVYDVLILQINDTKILVK